MNQPRVSGEYQACLMMLITACQNQPRVSGEYIHEWAANNVYPENQPRVSGEYGAMISVARFLCGNQPRVSGEYLPPGIGRG